MNDRDERQRGRPFKSGGAKAGGKAPAGRDAGGKGPRGKTFGGEGDKRPPRVGEKPRFPKRNDEKPRFEKREGERPAYAKRDGDKPRFEKREGERPAYAKRDGDKPRFGAGPGAKRPGAKNSSPPRRERPDILPRHPEQGERIAKAMARAGACSRRDAEEWIAAGRVAVNGRVLDSPAFNVTLEDRIEIDGKPMAARERTRLFMFHKPRGFVTTDRDPEGRETIFDYLGARHPELPRLMTVGRLDINTEGLLLMTNDGGLARVLELPATGWLRRYRVRAHGETDQAALDRLAHGVTIEGVDYAPIDAKLDRVQGANSWLTLSLREGKNREVRRVLASLALEVNRLIRVSYGPFQLGDLPEGGVEEVKTRVLRDQLGPSLIAAAGADFDTAAEMRREDPTRAEPRRQAPGRAPRSRDDERPRPSRAARPPRREEEAPAPLKERPKPGARKHVSVLRAERAAQQKGGEPRVKLERSATADRKGRAVVVERVVSAAPKPDLETRNGRRFSAERAGPKRAGSKREDPKRGAKPYAGKAGDKRADRADDGTRPPRRPQREGGSFAARDGERPARARNDGAPFKGPRDKAPRPSAERGPRPSAERGPRQSAERGPRQSAERGPRPSAERGPRQSAERGRNESAPRGPRKPSPAGGPKGGAGRSGPGGPKGPRSGPPKGPRGR